MATKKSNPIIIYTINSLKDPSSKRVRIMGKVDIMIVKAIPIIAILIPSIVAAKLLIFFIPSHHI